MKVRPLQKFGAADMQPTELLCSLPHLLDGFNTLPDTITMWWSKVVSDQANWHSACTIVNR